jgi:hypothetical protein
VYKSLILFLILPVLAVGGAMVYGAYFRPITIGLPQPCPA